MDQHIGRSSRSLEVEETVMTENMGRINERVQETVEGVQSTVHRAMEGFKQMQETADGAKTPVDEIFERVKGTVHEMVERVKPAADFLDDVQQNPWLLMGSVILMGYILGSFAREHSSAR
jgi:ElaB/YqjD/DUF883 family membrane-anchored ribosome-binding protein